MFTHTAIDGVGGGEAQRKNRHFSVLAARGMRLLKKEEKRATAFPRAGSSCKKQKIVIVRLQKDKKECRGQFFVG
jgi:hypothetical protein